MCNLYSITTNQAAIINLFRVINRYVGNLAPMPGVFPDYRAPVVRDAGAERELVMMRCGMPPTPRTGGADRPFLARLAFQGSFAFPDRRIVRPATFSGPLSAAIRFSVNQPCGAGAVLV